MQNLDAARREFAKTAAQLERIRQRRAELIRELRDERGLSFEQIARLANIHRSRAWQIYHRKS